MALVFTPLPERHPVGPHHSHQHRGIVINVGRPSNVTQTVSGDIHTNILELTSTGPVTELVPQAQNASISHKQAARHTKGLVSTVDTLGVKSDKSSPCKKKEPTRVTGGLKGQPTDTVRLL